MSSQYGLRLERDQLEDFDGRYNKVYIGCAGFIFDVTHSPNFETGGTYYYLKGKDLTVALAKQNFDLSFINANPKKFNLTDNELVILRGWTEGFQRKYPVVGYVITN